MLISDIRQRALKVDKGGYGWNVRFGPILLQKSVAGFFGQ
jgi:hypothetical protein